MSNDSAVIRYLLDKISFVGWYNFLKLLWKWFDRITTCWNAEHAFWKCLVRKGHIQICIRLIIHILGLLDQENRVEKKTCKTCDNFWCEYQLQFGTTRKLRFPPQRNAKIALNLTALFSFILYYKIQSVCVFVCLYGIGSQTMRTKVMKLLQVTQWV